MTSDSFGNRRQSEGLWDWNLVSNRIHFSPGWLSLVGCDEHEIGTTDQAWLQRVHPDDLAEVSQAVDAALAHGPDAIELRHRMLHKDGSYRWVACRAMVQRNADGRAVRVSGCHEDVTAEAVTDSLTGLPNHLLLMERLTRSIERARRYPGFQFAVLVVGLERTDVPEGPVTRDPILSGAARRLETCLRVREVTPSLRNNDLVARLDGDQFAILLDGLKEIGHAAIAADRILAEVLAPYIVSGHSVRVSASIGIAVSSTGYTRAGEVVRDAATALHRAELLGGKRCEVFDTAVLQLAQQELRLEAELDGALERGEFALFYQPIVSLESNQIVGFEALLRWQHPVLGMILPLEFVPIAERSGVIVPLGNWALREACRQLKEWQDSTPTAEHLWVSVNLSAVQLGHPRLVEEIGDALRDAGLEPRCLLLELTEGMAMENPSEVQTLLMQIRALGVRVSVDDFGTGHSALAYLRQFPLDSLKVDRSFVRGIEGNPDMASILGAVTTMTRQLGLQMVAEGIEKGEQLELVRSLDCEFGQGFLFSKPVDRDRAAAMVHDGLPPRPALTTAAAVAFPFPGDVRRLWTIRNMLAAAAVLAVLVSVGLPRYFTEDAAPAPDPATGSRRQADIPLDASVEPAGTQPPPPVAKPAVRSGSAAAQTEPTDTNAVRAQAGVSTLAGLVTSMRVVHQHRLGSCRGLLIVSRDGVAFVPDDAPDQAKDGFTLPHDQFLHALDGDSLIVRSAERAYRFRSEEAGGSQRLGTLVDSIAQLRKNP